MRNTFFYSPAPLNPIRIRLMDGVYLIKRKSDYLAIEHYGVLVVGKPLGLLGYSNKSPLVFHLTDLGFQVDWLEIFGNPEVLGKVDSTQEMQAIKRLTFASNNLNRWHVGNNCEHFARFVAEGISQSTQVQTVGILGGLALALYCLRDY